MNDFDEERLRKLLRDAIAPVGEQEPRFDLWPKVRTRMQQGRSIQIPWFDWVLAAVVLIVCLLIPETVGSLLLHL